MRVLATGFLGVVALMELIRGGLVRRPSNIVVRVRRLGDVVLDRLVKMGSSSQEEVTRPSKWEPHDTGGYETIHTIARRLAHDTDKNTWRSYGIVY
jgi:hypothetical protein